MLKKFTTLSSDDRFSFFNIDLNAEITKLEMENEGMQLNLAKEIYTHFPNFNIGV